jgi:ribosomal-protein-alanine N-acetyltransferase
MAGVVQPLATPLPLSEANSAWKHPAGLSRVRLGLFSWPGQRQGASGHDSAVTEIRPLTLEDAEALVDLVCANREFLAPWGPIRDPDHFTLDGQRAQIEKVICDQQRRLAVARVILDNDRIIGRVTLSNIVRGAFESCSLGYWISQADCGRGHASVAVGETAALAFSELGLHRIEAGTLPHNVASQRVLERNAFERFGLARRYPQIAGHWQDHVLFQRITPGG